MTKRKYYAVVRGKRPGIYDTWDGPQGAKAQVESFPQAVYKSFPTESTAEQWYRERGGPIPIAHVRSLPPPPPASAAFPAGLAPEDQLLAGRVVIFTDGACTGNPGPGGYGVVLRYRDTVRELSGGFARTTNNRMEMLAMVEALASLQGQPAITLYSDSSYVIDALQKGWAVRWRRDGWQRTGDAGREDVKNVDLWQRLLPLYEQHDVTLVQVKGHAGIADNERCDQLAVAAAQRRGLPPDPGFAAGRR